MTRRSDALTALVGELADLDGTVALAREDEEERRREWLAAQQALATARQKREEAEERQGTTREALALIQGRDGVSDDVVDAMRRAGS